MYVIRLDIKEHNKRTKTIMIDFIFKAESGYLQHTCMYSL